MPRARRNLLFATFALLVAGSMAHAQAPKLKSELAGVSFLVGDWSSGNGQVADTGGTATGYSHISIAANGGALLRQDHTQLFDKVGHPTGGFDQVMLIYAEAGKLQADYCDGDHVIHYASAQVGPGPSVVFATADAPNAPSFRLSYRLTDPQTLAIAFTIRPPGSSDFRAVATGTATKSH